MMRGHEILSFIKWSDTIEQTAKQEIERAILDLEGAPERTAVCILADKEETGSDGVSGMQSQAFEALRDEADSHFNG